MCSKCAHDSSLEGVPAQGAEGPVCFLQDVQVQRNPRQPVFPLLFSEHKFLHQFILKQKKFFFNAETKLGIIDLMDLSMSEFWEMVKDREAWPAAVPGVTKSGTGLRI